jgi:pyruvate/2-oxoglutarate dehydrogenase complex dihydrolipoamide dehydrogenase (E3) component
MSLLNSNSSPRIVVVGGGPTGIAAAKEAAVLGAQVTLIEANQLGGRSNWHSLMPSKVFLHAAGKLAEPKTLLQNKPFQENTPLALPVLRERITSLSETWSHQQESELKRNGVKLIQGEASLLSPNRLRITHSLPDGSSEELPSQVFDYAILACGSEPVFFNTIKPDGERILTPRMMPNLSEWPEQLIMIGGGVTGSEYAWFFTQAGVSVTWITDLPSFLPRCDDDISQALTACLSSTGVELHRNSPVESIETTGDGVVVTIKNGDRLEGSHAFIAIGRKADTNRLKLDPLGIYYTRQGVTIDGYGRTNVKNIYAVGDLAGPPYTVNRGIAQAVIAARHLVGHSTAMLKENTIPEAVYTQPQIAQVGLTEKIARASWQQVLVHRAEYKSALKQNLVDQTEGFVKILSDPKNDQILGGAAVGDHAADLVNLISLAILGEMSVANLQNWFPAYPTLGEVIFNAVSVNRL